MALARRFLRVRRHRRRVVFRFPPANQRGPGIQQENGRHRAGVHPKVLGSDCWKYCKSVIKNKKNRFVKIIIRLDVAENSVVGHREIRTVLGDFARPHGLQLWLRNFDDRVAYLHEAGSTFQY